LSEVRSITRGRYLAAALLLAGAVGCASTIQGGTQTLAGGSDGGSLGGPGGGLAGQSGPAGSAAGVGPGGGGAPGGVSSRGTGTVPGPNGRPTIVGPGITSTTISIGEGYSSQGAAGNRAIGASGAAASYDFRNVMNAVIDYANAHGGFAGRKLKALYYDYNITTDQDVQDQSACAFWTQDHKVFAIPGSSDIVKACAEKAGAVSLVSGASVASTYQKFPHFVEPYGIRLDREGTMTINGLYKAGYFAGKLGFVTYDDPTFRYAYEHGYLPALNAHGIPITQKAFVAVPQQLNDLGAMTAAMRSTVTKFRASGIDHVIIEDGHAGVWAGGGLTLEFMEQAESQHYFPRYGQNAENLPGSSELPADQQDKAIAVLDSDSRPSNDTGWHTNKTRDACFTIEADAGMPVSTSNSADEGFAAQACDIVFFLQRVFNRLTTALTSDAFINGVAGLGRSWPSAYVYGTEFEPGLRDGSAEVRRAEYLKSCECLRYSGPPYYP
jgi:hypothetical protein